MINHKPIEDMRSSLSSAYREQIPRVKPRTYSSFAPTESIRLTPPERTITNKDIESLSLLEYAAQASLLKYQAAMHLMETRLETLDEDLKLRRRRNPIHHVESRIKSLPSIFEKLERYGKEQTLESMERHIMDIAGLRVIVSYVQDAYDILYYLQHQDDLKVVAIKDYIANPKPNGYRSLHLIVTLPVFFLDGRRDIPVEIQIRTIAMDFWASLEHDLKYKRVRAVDGVAVSEELKICSEIIEDVEKRMQILASGLDSKNSTHHASNKDFADARQMHIGGLS